MNSRKLREQFEKEKGYPSWNCNDTVKAEYIEWLEEAYAKQQEEVPTDEEVEIAEQLLKDH